MTSNALILKAFCAKEDGSVMQIKNIKLDLREFKRLIIKSIKNVEFRDFLKLISDYVRVRNIFVRKWLFCTTSVFSKSNEQYLIYMNREQTLQR